MNKKRIAVFLKLKAKEVGYFLGIAVIVIVFFLIPMVTFSEWAKSGFVRMLWFSYIIVGIGALEWGMLAAALVVVGYGWIMENWNKAGELSKE